MNFNYEKNRARKSVVWVIGCDEVGRGSLAGPVVAGAAVLPLASREHQTFWKEIKDSKQLNADKRSELSELIKQHAQWSVGVVSEKIIDEINIHNATLLAMRKAVEGLLSSVIPTKPVVLEDERSLPAGEAGNPLSDEILTFKGSLHSSSDALLVSRDDKRDFMIAVDGKFTIPNINFPQEAIVGGDNKVISIAAASIIAKVYRDEIMVQHHTTYPLYNFAKHKGYGTIEHREAIVKHGLSPLHRLSFCSHLLPVFK